jgi:sporulation protein YlmC with PRC-barrel domain
MVMISELYGKKVIGNNGRWVGEVFHVVVDTEAGTVSHLLLGKIDERVKGDMIRELIKNSITFDRVKKIADTIVVGQARE